VSFFDRFSNLGGVPGMGAAQHRAPGQPQAQPQPRPQAPAQRGAEAPPADAPPQDNAGWDDFSGDAAPVEAPGTGAPAVDYSKEHGEQAPAREPDWEAPAAVERASAAVELASWEVAKLPDAARYSGAIDRMHRGVEEARARIPQGVAVVRQFTDAIERDAAALLDHAKGRTQ
jgi:hypothetical protein